MVYTTFLNNKRLLFTQCLINKFLEIFVLFIILKKKNGSAIQCILIQFLNTHFEFDKSSMNQIQWKLLKFKLRSLFYGIELQTQQLYFELVLEQNHLINTKELINALLLIIRIYLYNQFSQYRFERLQNHTWCYRKLNHFSRFLQELF